MFSNYKNPAELEFVYNAGCNFTNSVFFIFFHFCLVYLVGKFRLNLYRPSSLLLRRSGIEKSLCALMGKGT